MKVHLSEPGDLYSAITIFLSFYEAMEIIPCQQFCLTFHRTTNELYYAHCDNSLHYWKFCCSIKAKYNQLYILVPLPPVHNISWDVELERKATSNALILFPNLKSFQKLLQLTQAECVPNFFINSFPFSSADAIIAFMYEKTVWPEYSSFSNKTLAKLWNIHVGSIVKDISVERF